MSHLHDTKTAHITAAKAFLLVPVYSVAIPVKEGFTAQTLAKLLVSKGDYELPETLESYPVVNSEQLALHFPSYEVIPVLTVIETYRPRLSLTDTERQRRKTRIAEQAKRESKERRLADIASRTSVVDMSDFTL